MASSSYRTPYAILNLRRTLASSTVKPPIFTVKPLPTLNSRKPDRNSAIASTKMPSAHDKASCKSLGFCNHDNKSFSCPSSSEDKGWIDTCIEKPKLGSKFLTLPTVLTLGRVGAVPLLITTFYVDRWWGATATTSIFIIAAVTDWLDGYIARKMRVSTAFGAFLDPVADKLMVATTLVLLCTRPLEVSTFGQVPWILTVPAVAIIGREITMSAVREWAASQDSKLLEAVAVNNLGKWKTATQMTALTILLAAHDSSLMYQGIIAASGVVFLYVSAGLSVYSLAVYMSKIWKILIK